MKRKLLFIASLLTTNCFAATEIKEVARDWAVGAVSVSTNTVGAITATGVNFSGRYQIRIINTDNIYDISIGTHSAFTYAGGFIVTNSTDAATSIVTLPLNSGTTVYGLGQANSGLGSINIRVLEFK